MKSDESDELTCFVYTVCRIFPIELSQPNSLIRGVQMYKKKNVIHSHFTVNTLGFKRGNITYLNWIIFYETFWKSLTSLSRLIKVSSHPRLSRLVNATLNFRFFFLQKKENYFLICLKNILRILGETTARWCN